MEYQSFLNFLSVTATTSTIGLFLCGIQICTRIRKKGSTEGNFTQLKHRLRTGFNDLFLQIHIMTYPSSDE